MDAKGCSRRQYQIAGACGVTLMVDTGYLGFAESVRVGDVEPRNCIVQVVRQEIGRRIRGLDWPSVFERFLITFDFVRREMLFDPLPAPA